MASRDGRIVITYNGEIYNYQSLRSELMGSGDHAWHSDSDTEVLLALIEQRGIPAALKAIDGMFAFALWDERNQELTLARDRFGEKPLYYGLVRSPGGAVELVFGSELKALLAHPAFERKIDERARALYLRLGYVPEPHCIFQDVFKLPPGNFLQVSPGFSDERLKPSSYWHPAERIAELRVQNNRDPNKDGALEAVLTESVSRRLISDVPIGVFLSSGIDSSLTTALARNVAGSSLETFSIGFDDPEFDEAPRAAQIAKHLGVRHEILYASEEETLAVVPGLSGTYDEPFSDSSQIPTMVLSRLARSRVTVALSGDGGDELFGGYNRHVAARQYQGFSRLPAVIRSALGRAMESRSASNLLSRSQALFRSKGTQVPQLDIKLKKYARLFRAENLEKAYEQLISVRDEFHQLTGRHQDRTNLDVSLVGTLPPQDQLMLADTLGYLPGDVLTKVDRASMAFGLEVRTPYLSGAVFDFAWTKCSTERIRGNTGKAPLRDLLGKYVPRELWERPKAGFAVPLNHWLRTHLREWCEAVLDRERTNRSLDWFAVEDHWNRFLTGEGVDAYQVWNMLMYLDWFERWCGGSLAELRSASTA